jgi:hypothetical protein
VARELAAAKDVAQNLASDQARGRGNDDHVALLDDRMETAVSVPRGRADKHLGADRQVADPPSGGVVDDIRDRGRDARGQFAETLLTPTT